MKTSRKKVLRLRNPIWIGFLLLLAPGLLAAEKASKIKRDPPVPVPWEVNQKVELADGEEYFLVGKILYLDGGTYFRADFEAMPWLKTKRREKQPYYPLANEMHIPLEAMVGERVKVKARAEWSFFTNSQGLPDLTVVLHLRSKPEPIPTACERP